MCPHLVRYICTRPEEYEEKYRPLRTKRTVPRLGIGFWPEKKNNNSVIFTLFIKSHRFLLTLSAKNHGSKYQIRKNQLLDAYGNHCEQLWLQ